MVGKRKNNITGDTLSDKETPVLISRYCIVTKSSAILKRYTP